jgi:ribonuclease E
MPSRAAIYVLNYKRAKLHELESRCEMKILVVSDSELIAPDYKLDVLRMKSGEPAPPRAVAEEGGQERPGRRKRRSRRRRQDDGAVIETAEESYEDEIETADETEPVAAAPERPASERPDQDEGPARRRKRGRRGGRRRGRRGRQDEPLNVESATIVQLAEAGSETPVEAEDDDWAAREEEDFLPSAIPYEGDGPDASIEVVAEPADLVADEASDAPPARKRPRRRRGRRAAAAGNGADTAVTPSDAGEPADEPAPVPFVEVSLFETAPALDDVDLAAMPEDTAAQADEDRAAEKPAAEAPVEPEPVAAADDREPEAPAVVYTPETPPAEPPAISAEEQRQKRSGWWNRNW